MEQEDKIFLKKLQQEMLSQGTVGQPNPRFWVVMQTLREYWADDDVQGIFVFDNNACENVFEGNAEGLSKWIMKNLDDIESCECETVNDFISISCKNNDEYFLADYDEMIDFIKEYTKGDYSAGCYRERDEIVKDTFFSDFERM